MSNWRRTAVLRRAGAAAMRSYHTIQAIPRELKGSRVYARDRAQGRIPAVVFSQENLSGDASAAATSRPVARKHLLTTERKQIQFILKSVQLPFFCSTIFPVSPYRSASVRDPPRSSNPEMSSLSRFTGTKRREIF
ncbi:Exo-beta-D-glucosaminidase [Actinidia chinensis var. chinensis]|uniref:Exo-beta-D-glucosaminidase n=1 Tax=Actinidia chinensis var. chinensis TaxID=1590841 RepID=A0A2R6RL67_ACTCC|nr:Exo-beta-D-glucosaminidase [Actinidia chinensis var. chinensis]